MTDLRIDEWDGMIDVNMKGTLYGIAAALPYMKQQKSGHVINLEVRGFRGPARAGRGSFGGVCRVSRKPHRKS